MANVNAADSVKALFLDIGGVLLTNGWDRHARRRAAECFDLDYEDMNERHHLTFDSYERGQLGLEEYLRRVVFHCARSFSAEQFRQFMFAQSRPDRGVIELVHGLKNRYGLKLAAISNEGRELMLYRIHHFRLHELLDFFIGSCFVGYRKPDAPIYRMALDVAQVPAERVVYLDDRPMFAEVARDQGIRAIHHATLESTKRRLAEFGLHIDRDDGPR
jgi:putative hydrolase of the HAD superfamily